jgi:PPOX class probable F420-dependent enzyme
VSDIQLDPRIRDLFAGPNFAHVATSMRDGSPHVTVLWAGLEGDRVLFCKEEGSVTIRNLRRDPRIAISVTDVDDPYEEAHVRGTVVEYRGHDEAADWVQDTAIQYTGSPYPRPPKEVALAVVEIEHAGFSIAGVRTPAHRA